MFKKLASMSFIIPITLYAITDEFGVGFQAGVEAGRATLQEIAASQKNIDPEILFQTKIQEASETQYYQDGDKIPEGLVQKGNNIIHHDEALQQIQENKMPNEQDLSNIHELTAQVSMMNSSDLKGRDASDAMGHLSAPNGDFKQSISALLGEVNASKSVGAGLIFRGFAMKCRKMDADFSDCCEIYGWGQNLHLSSCYDEEKQLAQKRQAQLVIFIGEYCAHHYPWPFRGCREHKQTFCVFDSKLARIIQDNGRWKQLKIDFGSSETPNCSGITSQMLQKIDFSKINFSEYYTDIDNRVSHHDAEAIRDTILKKFNNGKNDHG